jgi:hypothetical protein
MKVVDCGFQFAARFIVQNFGSGSSPVLFPPVVSTVLFATVGLIGRYGVK